MNHNTYKWTRFIALGISLTLLTLIVTGCGKQSKNFSDLTFSSGLKTHSVTFQSENISPGLHLSEDTTQGFIDKLSQMKLAYAYEEFYGVEECYDRIFTDCTVTEHQASSLDVNGNFTATHLAEIVEKNNDEWLRTEKKDTVEFYKPVEGELLASVCRLIVETVNHVRQQYPDIDFERISCNLGRLKIFFKTGLLSFAAVAPDMTLSMSEHMLKTVDIFSGSDGTQDVLIHEVMHMIQLGCACEQIEHCERHAGITYMWDDVPFDGCNWAWLFESSAEQMMSLITGDDLVTYQTMVGYLQSVDLVTFLPENIPAYYAETISFYQEPNLLFKLFGCKTREDNIEIAKMMKAIDIIQMSPDDFMNAYAAKYQVDVSNDENLIELRRQLKPAIALTLTKSFYRTLAVVLASEDNIPANDVCFLMRLFEASLEHHIVHSDRERDEVNLPFLTLYRQVRADFFALFEESDNSLKENFLEYKPFLDNECIKTNASFGWLSQEKQQFLLDQTEFLSDDLDIWISES